MSEIRYSYQCPYETDWGPRDWVPPQNNLSLEEIATQLREHINSTIDHRLVEYDSPVLIVEVHDPNKPEDKSRNHVFQMVYGKYTYPIEGKNGRGYVSNKPPIIDPNVELYQWLENEKAKQ